MLNSLRRWFHLHQLAGHKFPYSLLCSFLGNFTFHSFSRTSLSVSVLQHVCYTYTVPFRLCTGTVVESPCFSVWLKLRIWTCDVLVAVIVTLLTAERKLGRRFNTISKWYIIYTSQRVSHHMTRIQIGLHVWNWTYSSLLIEMQSRRLTNLIISPMTSLWGTSMNTANFPPRFSFYIGNQIQKESFLLSHLFLQIHYLVSFHSVCWVF